MTIRVKCGQCGGEFQAKPELAGKHGKCPKCGGAIVVPNLPGSDATRKVPPAAQPSAATKSGPAAAPRQNAAPSGALGSSSGEPTTARATGGTPAPQGAAAAQPSPAKRCPSCGNGLQASAVICVHCGLDLRSGKWLGAQQSANAPSAPSHAPRSPAAGQCPSCDNPIPPGLAVCSVCGYDAQAGKHTGRSRGERRWNLSAAARADAKWGLVRAGLRLMCYSAIAQFLVVLWFTLTLGTALILVSVRPFWLVPAVVVFGGAAILRSLIERSEMGTIGLGVYVGSWLYMVVLISLLFFYPVAMVVGIVVVGLISCGLAIFAALAMLVGVTLNAMVPASRLRWLPLLCVVCLAIGAAAFVSALASGVSAVRSEIAQSVPPSARAAPAADSSMAGDPPADTQTSDRAAAKPSDGARTALAWAQVSLEGASIAVFAAYLLAALYLRGLAKFIGDESTASEATPFLAVSTILGVIAVISAVLTRSEALSHGLANFLLLVVLASSVPASVWFFRLIRSAHDLVAMATQ